MNRVILAILGIMAALVLAIGVLVIVLVATGGGDDSGDSTQNGQTGDNGEDGGGGPAEGELRLLGPEPLSLDPHIAQDADSAVYIVEIFGGLMTLDPQLQLQPDLAAEIPTEQNGGKKVNADGTVTCETNSGAPYQNVIIVAKSGGDFTSIQAALDSIVDASAGNPYLVRVGPGVYSERVTMKPFVDIEGAGESATRITAAGGAITVATVTGASNAELRFLTVENTGSGQYAQAIFLSNASPKITNVTLLASGSTYGYGVGIYASSAPTLTNVTANIAGPGYNSVIYNSDSTPVIQGSTLRASGGSVGNYAIWVGTGTVQVLNSTLVAGNPVRVQTTAAYARIASSKLDGGSNLNYGPSNALICAGVWDENYAFYMSTCP